MMKHKYLSKRYWNSNTTAMGKVNELFALYDDIFDFSLGDPDLITDEEIIDLAMRDAKSGHTKYTDFRGDPELRSEICKYYSNIYELHIHDENVMVTAGGCLAMYLVLQAILDDGDEVIIHAPYFTPYKQQIELARGVPVVLNTFEEEGFAINVQRLRGLITNRTKAIIINTPNNPTGACLSEKDMQDIKHVAREHGLLIIADDIYGSLSYQEPFKPFVLINGLESTITINSFSKDFVMTGWRVGSIIAPDYIIRTIKEINENVVFTASSVSQRAALYALKYRSRIQPPIVTEYKQRAEYAYKRINSINGLSVLQPKGTFYMFINIKQTGLTSKEFCEQLLKEAHILALPGDCFGDCGEGYIRIALTMNIERLSEAFDRMEKMTLFKKQASSNI
jgi:aspartate/methionine/tyrosine aminotransferase